jgi:hypothetical protein
MSSTEDPFAYYVPQTPRDSSSRNTFFRRSSPNPSKSLISTLNHGVSSIRNIGRAQDQDPPLQLRVTSLEDTLQAVHQTVNTLETTMSDIVTLLRASSTATATAPPPNKPPPTPIAKPHHIQSPRVSAITRDRSPSPITPSYSDTIRTKVPPPSIPTSAPMQAPIRGLRPNGSSSLPQDFDGDVKSPMVQRHRRRQDYISGHYWHNCQFDIHDGKGYPRFQVAWLHHNIDGPYEGKPDKLQKLTLSLADDSTKSFLRFYAAARSGLGACGYHEELLPALSTARVGFNVRDTPIVDEDLITVGKTMEIDEPPREHWQSQHATLGMNLYPLLEYAIKPSATRSRLLVENSVTLGNPNGLTITTARSLEISPPKGPRLHRTPLRCHLRQISQNAKTGKRFNI